MLSDDEYTRPVQVSKLGSAALAILVLPCIAATGAVIVASVVIARQQGSIGSMREILALGLGAIFFPVLIRAFFVLAARVFGKTIEPLVPWWLAIFPSLLFGAVTVWGLFTGLPGSGRLGGVAGLLVTAPVILYRQQHRTGGGRSER